MNVVVVAPYFGGNMVHAIRCFLKLDGVRVGLISHESEERVPADVRARIDGHYRISNSGDAEQLGMAVRAFQAQWGRVDRLEGYLEQLQVPIADAREAAGIDGMHGQAARNFRDKNRMKQVLREAGLPAARQAKITDPERARSFVAEVGFPIVLKPIDGAGAKNTVRVSDEEELWATLERMMPSPQNPIQAEEFIRAEEHTFETVMIDGKPIWQSSTYYLPGPLAVLENPWMQYCLLAPREMDQPHVQKFAPINHAALKALGMKNGLSHMEWFLMQDGRSVVSEVGARPPGANILSVNSAAHDTDMWEHWARLQVFREWNLPPRKYAAGCAFLRAQGPGRAVSRVVGLDECQQKIGHLVVDVKLPKAGQPRSSHYEGDGWVIVRHPETKGVIEALRTLVTELRIESA